MQSHLPNAEIFGRPIMPVAAGIAVSMVTLAFADVFFSGGDDPLGKGFFGDAVGWAALLSSALFAVAWVFRSPRALEVALMLATGVWLSRAIYFAFIGSFGSIFFWLAIAWTLVCLGAWFHDVWHRYAGGI